MLSGPSLSEERRQQHDDDDKLAELTSRLEQEVAKGCLFCHSRGLEDTGHSGVRCERASGFGGGRATAFQVAVSMDRFIRGQMGIGAASATCLTCFVPW